MPKIPDISVAERPTPRPELGNVGYQATSGAETAPGEALMRQGAVTGNAAEEIYHAFKVEQDRIDVAKAEDAMNKLNSKRMELTYGPEGFKNVNGGDAIKPDFNPGYMAKFSAAANEVSQGLDSPRQKQLFKTRAEALATQYKEGLFIHSNTENIKYQDGVDSSVIDNVKSEQGIDPANDITVGLGNVRVTEALKRVATRGGWSPEMLADKAQKVQDDMAISRYDAYRLQDPRGALQHFQAHQNEISPTVRLRIQNMLYEAALPVNAARVNSMGGVPAPAPSATSTPDKEIPAAPSAPPINDLIGAVIKQESGGNQAAVSPKGAIGVMQLIPSTAREMAAKIGVPFDEKKLATDANYNKALGTAYLQEQLTNYRGNTTLALAAYNAGPAKVDEWIKKFGDPSQGEISDADFTAKIPYKETRNYVQSITASLPVTPQPVRMADASGAVATGPVSYANITRQQAATMTTGDPVVDSLPPDQRIRVFQRAREQAAADQSQAIAVQNHLDAMARRGKEDAQQKNYGQLLADTMEGKRPDATLIAQLVRYQLLSPQAGNSLLNEHAIRDDPETTVNLWTARGKDELRTENIASALKAGKIKTETAVALTKSLNQEESAADKGAYTQLLTSLGVDAFGKPLIDLTGQAQADRVALVAAAQGEWNTRVRINHEKTQDVLNDMTRRYSPNVETPAAWPRPRMGEIKKPEDIALVWANMKGALATGQMTQATYDSESMLLQRYAKFYNVQAQQQAARAAATEAAKVKK